MHITISILIFIFKVVWEECKGGLMIVIDDYAWGWQIDERFVWTAWQQIFTPPSTVVTLRPKIFHYAICLQCLSNLIPISIKHLALPSISKPVKWLINSVFSSSSCFYCCSCYIVRNWLTSFYHVIYKAREVNSENVKIWSILNWDFFFFLLLISL